MMQGRTARLAARITVVVGTALLLLLPNGAAADGVPHRDPPWLWMDLTPGGDHHITYDPCDLPLPPEWSWGVENWDGAMCTVMHFDEDVCAGWADVHIRWEMPGRECPCTSCYGCSLPMGSPPPPWDEALILFDYDKYNPFTSPKKTAGSAHEWGHIMDLYSVGGQNCDSPYRIMAGLAGEPCIAGPSPMEAYTVADFYGWSGADRDGDDFSDAVEIYVGTDPLDDCADGWWDDAWPPDFNNDTVVDITDALMFVARFPSCEGVPPYDARFDINADGCIDVTDWLIFSPYFPSTCAGP